MFRVWQRIKEFMRNNDLTHVELAPFFICMTLFFNHWWRLTNLLAKLLFDAWNILFDDLRNDPWWDGQRMKFRYLGPRWILLVTACIMGLALMILWSLQDWSTINKIYISIVFFAVSLSLMTVVLILARHESIVVWFLLKYFLLGYLRWRWARAYERNRRRK